MNYWKKMTLALALVAGLCGGAWAAQDPGHGDRNHDRDSHRWSGGDRHHGRDRDHDRNWDYRHDRDWDRDRQSGYAPNRTWGYYPNGNYGYYPYGTYYPGGAYGNYGNGGYNAASVEYQRGYRDGVMYGRSARTSGRGYHPLQQAPYAKNADYAYRNGFAAGYNAGFGRG